MPTLDYGLGRVVALNKTPCNQAVKDEKCGNPILHKLGSEPLAVMEVPMIHNIKAMSIESLRELQNDLEAEVHGLEEGIKTAGTSLPVPQASSLILRLMIPLSFTATAPNIIEPSSRIICPHYSLPFSFTSNLW